VAYLDKYSTNDLINQFIDQNQKEKDQFESTVSKVNFLKNEGFLENSNFFGQQWEKVYWVKNEFLR
jgi:hypothetical protein